MKWYSTTRVGGLTVVPTVQKTDNAGVRYTEHGVTVTPVVLWYERDPKTNILKRGPELFDTVTPTLGSKLQMEAYYGEDKWQKPYEEYLKKHAKRLNLTQDRPKQTFQATLSEEEWAAIQEGRGDRGIAAAAPVSAPPAPGVRVSQGLRTVSGSKP